jgi:hypothetical protein
LPRKVSWSSAISKNKDLKVSLEGDPTGISRLSITSDDWHEKNPKMSTKMWGFRWKHVKSFVCAMFGLKHKDSKQGNQQIH